MNVERNPISAASRGRIAAMRTEPFQPIEELLFTSAPDGIFYHYTSVGSLLHIIRSGVMFASDVGYLNDAAESTHTMNLIKDVLARLTTLGGNWRISGLDTLSPGMRGDLYRLAIKRAYVTCFTKQGSLLSQWRGYCPLHRGVSIGFQANDLRTEAEKQGFRLRECLYDPTRQSEIASSLAERLRTADTPSPKAWELCTEAQALDAVLEASTVLKHPSFSEEQEWRVISVPPKSAEPRPKIEFREGRAMLIPYRPFRLPRNDDGGVKLQHVIVGPTPHENAAIDAVSNFLLSEHSYPAADVDYCNIPLREA